MVVAFGGDRRAARDPAGSRQRRPGPAGHGPAVRTIELPAERGADPRPRRDGAGRDPGSARHLREPHVRRPTRWVRPRRSPRSSRCKPQGRARGAGDRRDVRLPRASGRSGGGQRPGSACSSRASASSRCPQRYYPAGPLAAQVLGFVDVDGVGIAGWRTATRTSWPGTPGERTAELSADGLAISTGPEHAATNPCRADLDHHDVDRQMQFMAEAALERAVEQQRCAGRHRDRDGSADRGRLRDGDLPVVRPERLR